MSFLKGKFKRNNQTTQKEQELERSDSSSIDSDPNQAGVAKLEALATVWSKWALYVAYAAILLQSTALAIEVSMTSTLLTYAQDEYKQHALLGSIYLVQTILLSVMKPIMAKVADVFGRLEAFAISIFLLTLGYIMIASSNGVRLMSASLLFYSAGSTGVQILIQILVADTSDLLNRALVSSLPDIPFLFATWCAPPIISYLVTNSTWRWGFGMWAIIFPIVSLPLLLSLFSAQRKAARKGLNPPSFWQVHGIAKGSVKLFWEMDFLGIIIFTGGLVLALLPLTFYATPDKWTDGGNIAMITIGVLLLVALPFFESSRLAPYPLLPLKLLKNRTVSFGCLLGFLYFMSFYLSIFPYFYSYLIVARNTGLVAANNILRIFNFASVCSSIFISLCIKFTKQYKIWMLIGVAIYVLGIGLLVRYRTPDASDGLIIMTQIFIGVGAGALNVPAQLAVQASVSHQHLAVVTALFLVLVSVGGAVGNAISGAIWTQYLPELLAEYLPAEAQGELASIYAQFSVAASYPIGSPVRTAIIRAYDEVMHKLLIGAVVVSCLMIPCALLMHNYKLDTMQQNVKGVVFGGEENMDRPIRTYDSNGDYNETSTASQVRGETSTSQAKYGSTSN